MGSFPGEVLPGGGEADWIVPHSQRLEEVRLSLLETMVAARLDLGASDLLIGELEVLVDEHPLREALWCSLMVALYRAGRQADALAAYARLKRQLAQELGLDPSPASQAVEQQILLQDPSLDAGRRAPRGRTNAPALTAPMIGRDHELQAVARLLRRGPLVTIVGPAGVGKTRLAVEAVRRADHPGGAWLVRLDGARDAAAVLQAVGEALGVAGATEPLLLEQLRSARLLLSLDNCEQVVGEVGELVSRVLDAAPWVDVLCTSQRPLGVVGEATCHLTPLAVEDSTRLFRQLAAGHRPSAVLDGDSGHAVTELCLALDGLPLAIELAAARVTTLTVDEIARRLQDRFALLTDPTSRLPERRRALGAAIGWSYDLLFPDDQRGCGRWATGAGAPRRPPGRTAAPPPVELLGGVRSRKLTAGLIVLAAISTNAAFTALGSAFDYPDIRKQPVDQVLGAFRASQSSVVGWFSVMALAAALFAPIAAGIGRLSTRRSMALAVPVGLGL